MASLADIGREIGSIAEGVGPSVVGIGNRWRGGSGVVIGENRIRGKGPQAAESGSAPSEGNVTSTSGEERTMSPRSMPQARAT